ncbi:MAG: carboxypeptidase-like regulatory domain-containing protein [Blastocatellia bacterium]
MKSTSFKPLQQSFALCLLLCGLASAQTAQLTGRITDAGGAVVAEAAVTVTQASTGVTRETVSNDEGYFTVPLLPPGEYQITVQKQEFPVGVGSVAPPASPRGDVQRLQHAAI